jgi:hypothetical protein
MAEQVKNEYNQSPLNRAEQIDNTIAGVKDTNETFLSIGLLDIDTAISWYFNNVIKPTIVENNQVISVPVMYGSEERWKSVQQNGFLRDNKGRLITPLIVYKRTSVAKDTSMPVDKLDANNPQLFHTVEKKYTQKNRYDNFNVLNNQVPIKEYYNIIMPDYIVATYDVVLWTTYQTQMNSIVESMVFSSDAYWGDKDRFRFRTSVSDIATPIEITNDADRTLKSTFTLTVNGYISSNTVNRILANQGSPIKKSLSIKKVVLFTETDDIPSDIFSTKAGVTAPPISTFVVKLGGGGGGTTTTAINNMFGYLNKQFVKTANTIVQDAGGGNSTATFSGVTIATVPLEYPQTQGQKENFTIFCNGQYIDHAAISSFSQSGADIVLTVNTGSLGYSLNTTDTVVAVGKFNS